MFGWGETQPKKRKENIVLKCLQFVLTSRSIIIHHRKCSETVTQTVSLLQSLEWLVQPVILIHVHIYVTDDQCLIAVITWKVIAEKANIYDDNQSQYLKAESFR